MLMAVTFLTFLTRIPYGITIFRSCVPNTQFLLNGRLCNCNSLGQSTDASCELIGRRQTCQPGQVIWEECSQCICQDNGKLLCTNTECTEESLNKSRVATTRSGSAVWCTPFRSYYVNCTLCVCPASGKMSEARCATDSSCALKGLHTSLDTIPQNICIPKVMYLFTCLHCLCSDDGVFLKSKCIETCHKPTDSTKRCIPKSFYLSDCNICRCPESGISEDSICSKSSCSQSTTLSSLSYLRNITSSCSPNSFTKPRCVYCECSTQGIVNEQACVEQECLKIDDFSYDSIKSTCSVGEMVPTCIECFCPRSKLTVEKYCSRVCSPQNKLVILENVLKEKVTLIDRSIVKETTGTDTCDANALFLDQGRYCLCSDEGTTNNKHCTSVLEDTGPKKPSKVFEDNDIQRKIDLNTSCEPNTYIEFGCNSCYCTKEGKIDAKWCTSDDCEAKKVIHDNNNKVRTGSSKMSKEAEAPTTCVPGSIAKIGCNFCICGKSSLMSERACTKNVCSDVQMVLRGDEFSCEPSAYYTVDCNMCYCPSDGVKNLEKCTKNQCESNFLRSDSCTPGELFSDDCNICVCPPNGDKKYKVCTNRTCSENDTPWKKIFKISQNLLSNQVPDPTKSFEPCFPGEEFEVGCKVCMCPDMGLKEYATCTAMLCDDSTTPLPSLLIEEDDYHFNNFGSESQGNNVEDNNARKNSEAVKNGEVYNISGDVRFKESVCTPGSEYIINCKVCICPYAGSIHSFCREMESERYCEQAYPGFDYMPFGRRTVANNITLLPNQIYISHNHTKYSCNGSSLLQDGCYQCQCNDNVLIREHCYKSNATDCTAVSRGAYEENTGKQTRSIHSFCREMESERYCEQAYPGFDYMPFGRRTFAISKYDYLKTSVKPCRIGDVVQNACVKCLCTSKNVFDCTSLHCDEKKISEKKKDTFIKSAEQMCLPKQLYVLELVTCICNKDGRWPHKSCYEAFRSLPPKSVVHHKCNPDTYVAIDCNVCRCDSYGEFIRDRCTKNNCGGSSTRKRNSNNNIYSNCETKNWYSFAPCQFCYCVNKNILVCNTGNDTSEIIGLGTHEMKMCGRELLLEAIELVPKQQRNFKKLLSDSEATDTATKKDNEEEKTDANTDFNIRSQYLNGSTVNRQIDIQKSDEGNGLEYNSTTLKINVPEVLNKVIEMALRKSFVSLVEGSKCEQGKSTSHGCNVCFCLKNGKLLCTNQKCD